MIFHQFTYAKDSAKSAQSVRSIRRIYPDAPIYLWEDHQRPLDPDLDYMDAIIRPTTFRRAGNLNGPECVLGMRECYRIGYEEHPDAQCHIKFDPDSLMLRADQLDSLVDAGTYYFSPARTKTYIHGWFQYQSRAFFEDYYAIKDIRSMCRQPSWNEDLVFWEAACTLAKGREVRDYRYPEPRICVFFDHENPEPLEKWFGFSALMMGHDPDHRMPHEQIASTMEAFMDQFITSQLQP